MIEKNLYKDIILEDFAIRDHALGVLGDFVREGVFFERKAVREKVV